MIFLKVYSCVLVLVWQFLFSCINKSIIYHDNIKNHSSLVVIFLGCSLSYLTALSGACSVKSHSVCYSPPFY